MMKRTYGLKLSPLSFGSLAFIFLGLIVFSTVRAADRSQMQPCEDITVTGRVLDKSDRPINGLELKLMKFLGKDERGIHTVLTPGDPETVTDVSGQFLFCITKTGQYIIEAYQNGMRAFLLIINSTDSLAVVNATEIKQTVDLRDIRAPFDK